MLWQLRCHCNPDHDKFSSTVVAIFPNVCLWRRSLCSNLALTLKNCIEPPSYASTAYVVAIYMASFLFDSFVKIWDTWDNFLGKWFTAPPGKKFPVRLWSLQISRGSDKPAGQTCSHANKRYMSNLLWKLLLKRDFPEKIIRWMSSQTLPADGTSSHTDACHLTLLTSWMPREENYF